MSNSHLALRGVLDGLIRALPLHELGVSEAQIREGIDEICAQLLRVGLDAFHARQSGIPFYAAAEDPENYPHLLRFHFGATDIIQVSLPEELVPWLDGWSGARSRPSPQTCSSRLPDSRPARRLLRSSGHASSSFYSKAFASIS